MKINLFYFINLKQTYNLLKNLKTNTKILKKKIKKFNFNKSPHIYGLAKQHVELKFWKLLKNYLIIFLNKNNHFLINLNNFIFIFIKKWLNNNKFHNILINLLFLKMNNLFVLKKKIFLFTIFNYYLFFFFF